ncbi:MAG: hypothetical protein Q9165_001162 [Trypethelium subeluteriae]
MDYPSDEWLRTALRYSLKTSLRHSDGSRVEDITVSRSGNDLLQHDNRFYALIKGIRFSRKFILTYQVVLLVILLSTTIVHWSKKIHRARRKRNTQNRTQKQWNASAKDTLDGVRVRERDCGYSPSSSSSSTVQENAYFYSGHPPPKNGHENTPLLGGQKAISSQKHNAISRLRAFLLYQPRQIPYIKKTLSPNGTTIFILLFVSLNVFYTFFRLTLTEETFFLLGDRAGLVFVANLPWLYLLSAKNTPIKHLTGYSYDALNIFHRRLGEILCLEALIHTIGMFLAFLTLQSPRFTFLRFLTSKITILGLLAFVSYETLYFSSLSSIRQRWYETFLLLHVLLQLAALIFLFFHHHGARPYVAAAMAIFLIDRLVFRLLSQTRTLRADLTVAHDENTVLVSTNWQLPRPLLWTRWTGLGGVKYGWKPAQHVYITVPSLGRRHVLQAHPFTIASAAPGRGKRVAEDSEGGTTHAWLNLIVRAHDGFSRDLLQHALSRPQATLRVDGPYGSSSALHLLRDADLALLVAGGSGIAVAFPLLWSLLMDPCSPSPDSDDDIEDPHHARRHESARRVCLIWIVHRAEHLAWIGDERLRELDERGLDIVVPQPTGEAGRPDMRMLVRNAAERHEKGFREEGWGGPKWNMRTAVVCSGPDEMNREVRNECAGMIRDGRDVAIEVEKFGW